MCLRGQSAEIVVQVLDESCWDPVPGYLVLAVETDELSPYPLELGNGNDSRWKDESHLSQLELSSSTICMIVLPFQNLLQDLLR